MDTRSSFTAILFHCHYWRWLWFFPAESAYGWCCETNVGEEVDVVFTVVLGGAVGCVWKHEDGEGIGIGYKLGGGLEGGTEEVEA